MNKKDYLHGLILVGIVMEVASMISTTTASAKTYKSKTTVTKIKNIKNYYSNKNEFVAGVKFHRIKSKNNKNLKVYTNRWLTSYKYSKKTNLFYATAQETVKLSNGKIATYRFVKDKFDLDLHGWIWCGYLTPKATPKKITSSYIPQQSTPTSLYIVAHPKSASTTKSQANISKIKQTPLVTTALNKSFSDTNYYGLQHVETTRKALVKFADILKNHPDAWDGQYGKNNSTTQGAWEFVKQVYDDNYNDFAIGVSTGEVAKLNGNYAKFIKLNNKKEVQSWVNGTLAEVNKYIAKAKY